MPSRLSDDDIESIVGILDGWRGLLTWEQLVDKIEMRLKRRYSRQALDRHVRIKSSFQATKKRLGDSPGEHKGSLERQVLLQTIDRLKNENLRLKKEADALLDQFMRWAYNAHRRGLSKADLDKPLPKVNRY